MLGIELQTTENPPTLLEKIHQLFDRLTDQLFGDNRVKPVMTRRAYLSYFGLALFLALILVLRRVDTVTTPQFWAEDGSIIFRNTVLFNFWDNITTNVYGYPYPLPKLIGQFALPFGFEAAPLVYALAANFCNGLLIAAFNLPNFKHIIKSDRLRIVFCVLVVCLPNSTELAGSVVNISWYIGIWAVLTAFMVLPRSWWAIAGLVLVHFICIYSSPSSIVIAPIWLLRLVRGGLRRDRQEIVVALAILGTIASIFLLTGDLGSGVDESQAGFSVFALVNFLSTRIISDVLLGRQGILLLASQFGIVVGYLVMLLVLVGLLLLGKRIRYRNILFSLAFFAVITGSVVITLVGRKALNVVWADPGDVLTTGAGRYMVLGNSLICLILLLSLDRLQPSRFKYNLVAVVLTVMALAMAQTFVLPARSDTNWPVYARQIPAALASDTAPPLAIPIQPVSDPAYWFVYINEDVTPPGLKITPDTVLSGAAEYSQTFKSECSRLNSVSLLVAAGKNAAGSPVLLELRDESGQAVVASQTLLVNPTAADSWQKIYFHPVDNSLGKTYRLYISSPGAQSGEGIVVYRSKSDQYANGEAFVNRESIQADLAFSYSCRPIPRIN